MEKVAVVTGASRGIGAAIAKELCACGYRVAVCYRTGAQAAQALCEALTKEGKTAAPFCVDVRREESVRVMFQKVREALGEPSLLVNNAGIARQKLFTDLTADDWDDMMASTVRGAFLCTREALPAMIRRKWGRVVNISSMWGQVGASCEVDYSAAKAAVIGMTKALAKEVAPSGITVNAVAPGAVDTDMLACFSQEEKQVIADETPLERLGAPEDIAKAVAFLCSDDAGFITGQVLGVNGGFVI